MGCCLLRGDKESDQDSKTTKNQNEASKAGTKTEPALEHNSSTQGQSSTQKQPSSDSLDPPASKRHASSQVKKPTKKRQILPYQDPPAAERHASPQVQSPTQIDSVSHYEEAQVALIGSNSIPEVRSVPQTTSQNTPKKTIKYRKIGLNNIGNTCFANSVLTCLYFIPELYDLFTRQDYTPSTALESAMKDFYSDFQDTSNPGNLVRAILKEIPKYDNRRQNPAYIFLKDLITALKDSQEEINSIFEISIEEVKVCAVCAGYRSAVTTQRTFSLAIMSPEIDKKALIFNENTYYCGSIPSPPPYSDYINSLLTHYKQIKPRLKSSKTEDFSLENGLKFQLSSEIWESNLALFCQNTCESEQTHLKQHFLQSIGPIFIFYFERFHLANPRVSIDVPMEMNMGEYVRNAGKYELLAVVNHFGVVDSGHYTACAKHGNTWYECDDSSVREIGPDPGFRTNTNIIIAIYHRTHPPTLT